MIVPRTAAMRFFSCFPSPGVVFGLLILPEILGRAGFYDSIIAAVVSSVLAIALVCMAIRVLG